MRETALWANQNPVKSGEILAKYSKIDPAVVATMARAHYADRLTPALMQPLIDASAKYNDFKPFPATELIYMPAR
jgi:ABC-type nitrate/sulfonate/bicarbonate transport system substrate-binding protein